jgi:hypothetical protein
VTYQRIIELGSEEDMEQGIAASRHEIYGPRAEDVTEDELKLCFHRVTLYLEQSHVDSQLQTAIANKQRGKTIRLRLTLSQKITMTEAKDAITKLSMEKFPGLKFCLLSHDCMTHMPGI